MFDHLIGTVRKVIKLIKHHRTTNLANSQRSTTRSSYNYVLINYLKKMDAKQSHVSSN